MANYHSLGEKVMTRDSYRELLYAIFLPITLAFIIILIMIGIENGFDFVGGLGIGAVIGVLLKCLGDGWNFFFRTSGNRDKKE